MWLLDGLRHRAAKGNGGNIRSTDQGDFMLLKRVRIERMLRKGKRQIDIAKQLRCSRQYVHLVHNGIVGSAVKREKVCQVCNKPLTELHQGMYLHSTCAQLRMRLQQNRIYYGKSKEKLKKAIDKNLKGIVMCQVRLDMPNASLIVQLKEIARRLTYTAITTNRITIVSGGLPLGSKG